MVNVSNLPRPNFIAIDEGFGSLDTDNFNSLYLLFDYLKNQFDFIVTISHIDKTRDMVDQIIDMSQKEAEETMRKMATQEGIFCGVSSGGSVAAALRISKKINHAVIVAIVCDRGDRYLSSGIYAQ